VGGELDLMTAGQLEAFALGACRPGDQVVLDLADVSFLDCSGLRALLRVHHQVRRWGGVSRLVAPAPVAGRVLEITGVDRCMPVYAGRDETVDAAVAAREPR
jgi:anti-sigma B factor antagonist